MRVKLFCISAFCISVISVFFVIMACSDKDVEIEDTMFDLDFQLIIFEKEREISQRTITFEGKEKDVLKAWAESIPDTKKDYNSYAPSVVLYGKKIKVNFKEQVTVVSLKKEDDPKASWKQYSRIATKQDKQIKSILEQIK